ncbi:hypothetical protein MRA01_52930 [Methylobacterium radiotolerans]|nr:hypothetical protein MRA01_52930 [Methylobacterium radiotolerans]
MAPVAGQSIDLNDVVGLTIALALRCASAKRQGELVLKSQIEALGRVASFLRERLNEWPPHLSGADRDIPQILPNIHD